MNMPEDRMLSAEEVKDVLWKRGSSYSVDAVLASYVACEKALRKAEAEILRWKTCSTCGNAPHPSGLTCVCGGTGSAVLEVEGLRKVALEAEARLERATDLVRYKRMELHEDNLISDEEYVELLSKDGAVKRLRSYDEARADWMNIIRWYQNTARQALAQPAAPQPTIKIRCEECNGTRRISTRWTISRCPACNGTGEVSTPEAGKEQVPNG
jgi:hypothetical protein